MQAFRKLLILSHRYIGIPLSFLFVVWFASAFVMIYAGGMPRITPEMRVESALPLDFSQVNLTASEAAERAFFPLESPVTLRTLLGRPAYDFVEPGYGSVIVFADNGEILEGLNEDQSRQVAGDFLGISPTELSFAGTVSEADQWTLTQRNTLPAYKFEVDDGLGTEIYISPSTADVNVYTTSRSRLLAWLGTIPHWFYFTSLRLDQPLWYSVVVWSSGIGCIMALLGLFLGVTQFRKTRPFNLSRSIPYKGMMRWHYILGVVFGVVTLTWVFSGMLSMEPFAWTNSRGVSVDRGVYRGGEMNLAAFPAINASQWSGLVDGDIKQVEYSWLQGDPYYQAHFSNPRPLDYVKRERLHQPYQVIGQAESESLLINARDFSIKEGFEIGTLVEKLDAAVPDATISTWDMLSEYDDYYYSRNSQIPLPVVRVKFDDPVESWVYVDPKLSQVLTTVTRWNRLERWVYNGFHSLDFAFWYHKRPLWDIGVITLLMGGFLGSCIGLYFGLRRLKQDVHYLVSRLVKLFRSDHGELAAQPEKS